MTITITLGSRTTSCERPRSDREEARPASPLRRLPAISQLPVKFVWTSGRANKDKAWVFWEAIGYEPKTKQKPSVLLRIFFVFVELQIIRALFMKTRQRNSLVQPAKCLQAPASCKTKSLKGARVADQETCPKENSCSSFISHRP